MVWGTHVRAGQEAAAAGQEGEKQNSPGRGPRLANKDTKAQSVYIISDAQNCV